MTRRLVVHVGTGKTGSTAIQRFLARRAERLRTMDVQYWGLNLEGAFSPPEFPWQHVHGIRQLQRLEARVARRELRQALARAVAGLPDGATAIWSNEAIHERPRVFIPLLKRLRDVDGIEVVPVVYVRNHRDYARSAYAQWGIRDKSYHGRIRSFRDWVAASAGFLSYGRSLVEWEKAFPRRLQIANYDAIGDVVGHFAGLVSADLKSLARGGAVEANRSPSPRMLALHALYNNLFAGASDPTQFEMLARRQPLLRDGLEPDFIPLASLVPTAAEVEDVAALLAEDGARVDEMLARHGQPRFDEVRRRGTRGSGSRGKDGPAAAAGGGEKVDAGINLGMDVRIDARAALGREAGDDAGAKVGEADADVDVDVERLAAELLSTLMRVVVSQDQALHSAGISSKVPLLQRVKDLARAGSRESKERASSDPAAQGPREYDPYAETPPFARILGHLDRIDERAVEGWIAIEGQPGLKLAIELVRDGDVVSSVVANRPRPDLAKAGTGGGACAFRLEFPPGLSPAQRASLEVRVAGSAVFLRPDARTSIVDATGGDSTAGRDDARIP